VKAAIDSLGNCFTDDLCSTVSSTEPEVRKSITDLENATAENAEAIIDTVKTAFIKLTKSEQHANADEDSKNNSKLTLRAFARALEGLCSRSDVSSNKVIEVCDSLNDILKKPSGKFLLVDYEAKLAIRNILIRNWKAPIKDYKVPPTTRSKEYRKEYYKIMLDIAKDPSTDILFLRTPTESIPAELRILVTEFRTDLIQALRLELGLQQTDKSNYSSDITTYISEILTLATEIPKEEWSEEARSQKRAQEENQRSFQDLQSWAITGLGINQEGLQAAFNSMASQNEVLIERLTTFKDLYNRGIYTSETDLNKSIEVVLNLTGLDSDVNPANLSEANLKKGQFFFRYLNHVMEKAVTVEGTKKGPLKNYLSASIRERILHICQKIAHDRINFPSTARDYAFFINPLLTSVPGQALSLHHKLTKCFKLDGYIDMHELKPLVIGNAVHNFSPAGTQGEKIPGGFVLSGPPGTGKSSFADAVSGQLAIPIFKLNGSMIKATTTGGLISYGSREITVGEFFSIVKANSPCVLLLDDAEKFLSPGERDPINTRKLSPEEEKLLADFLPELQNIRDQRGASKVILIATTNLPTSRSINVTSINEQGECQGGKEELFKHMSFTAFRDGRFDHTVFSFHKLYNQKQGKELAIAFLKPLQDSGKLIGAIDYEVLGEVIKDYTPATLEKVIGTLLPKPESQITAPQLLESLQRQTDRFFVSVDPEILERVQGRIRTLVDDGEKTLNEALDYPELAIAAKGLSPKQIKTAIEDLTPEALTQQNILSAFEQVRESS